MSLREQYGRFPTRTVFILGGWALVALMMIGDCQEDESEPVSFSREPIPDLGVSPQVQNPRVTTFTRQQLRDMRPITSEELLQNIEDAEMKGMDDDPATLEDLKEELK